jgi:transcriptional regulator GlxA family with amidase domain
MVTVDVLVLSGAMPSSVAITFDVLATANRLRSARGRRPAFDVRVAGSGSRQMRPLFGPVRPSDASVLADVLVLPGLGATTEAEIIARLQRRDAVAASRAVVAAIDRGAEVATSCSGTFLVASTGALDGRRATSSWWLAPIFRRMHPRVKLDTDALVVTDGPVTTAGAAMAQMDLALSLVTRHGGAQLADECARYLLLDERRSQTRYMALGFLSASNPAVAKAEAWARARLEHMFSVDEMAAAAGLSPRTFARHVERATGLSPVRFVQRLRAERAIELIETTHLPIDEVARRVGYSEPSTLRRVLQQFARRGPRELRAARGG